MVGLFLLFCWPFFLYRKYGNKDYKLENRTIIICNHYSTFDAFFIYLVYGKKKIYFVTITETKKRYLSRFVTWLFDCLFIEFEGVNLGFFKQAISILNNDGIICIFPEGVINPRKYGFFDFKCSYIYFARKTNAKILPLFLYPELKAFKRSKLYIGDVINVEDYAQYDMEGASTFIQSKIMEYSNMC